MLMQCLRKWGRLRHVAACLARRQFNSSSSGLKHMFLKAWDTYQDGHFAPDKMRFERKQSVFANADTPTGYLEAYGFDYDYTIAQYRPSLEAWIYDRIMEQMVEMGYPRELLDFEYNPSFGIKGLCLDKRNGYIMKLDQFGKIALDTVHLGHRQVPASRVIDIYRGVTVTPQYQEQNMRKMFDLFALPELCALADTFEMFERRKGQRDSVTVSTESVEDISECSPDETCPPPLSHNTDGSIVYEHVYADVRRIHDSLHVGGAVHGEIIDNVAAHLQPDPLLCQHLCRMRLAGKKLFLVTNSPYELVDKGMQHILGGFEIPDQIRQLNRDRCTQLTQQASPDTCELTPPADSDWLQLFDIVVVRAGKPKFFQEEHRRFRQLCPHTGMLQFRQVDTLLPQRVYSGGCVHRLQEAMGNLRAANVMYFGDHVGADLEGPASAGIWRTGCIIRELEREQRIMSQPDYARNLQRLLALEELIDLGQEVQDDPQAVQLLHEVKEERSRVREKLKFIFNPRFGSSFRTSSHRSSFFFSVGRYSDVYLSNLVDFFEYPGDYCHYAKRRVEIFPHEHSSRQAADQM